MHSNRLKLAWFGFIFTLVCLSLARPARADTPEVKDIFAVIGMTPQKVVSSMEIVVPSNTRPILRPEFSANAWVGMPMTVEHRKQFIEALRAGDDGLGYKALVIRDVLLDLLEEDGRVEESLALLPGAEILDESGDANPARTSAYGQKYALVRRAGFLIKAGRNKEAADLVGKIREIPIRYYYLWADSWTAISAVDLAMGRSKQVIETTEFLLRETAVDARSFDLLARQQIKLARLVGGMDAMIADEVPPTLRAVRLNILGRSEEAVALGRAALPSLSAMDLLRMLNLKDFNKVPGFGERASILLDDPGVATGDKADLLRSFEVLEKRLDAFFAMKQGHDKLIRELGVESLTPRSSGKNDRPDLSAYLARCDRMLELYPNEPRFHFFRAACVDPGDPSYRNSLATVAQSGPADSALACDAIRLLLPICTANELDRIITQATGYRELPAADRLQRLHAAELDQRVVEMLDGVDFSRPEGDAISSDVGSHLSYRSQSHEIPAHVGDRVLPHLTRLCVGSSEKTAVTIQSSIRDWFTMLSRVKVPDETLIRAARDIAAIVAERKISIQGDIFQPIPPEIREAAGIAMPVVKPGGMNLEFPPWSMAIEMFGHPEAVQFQRYSPDFATGRAQINGTKPGQIGMAVGLLAISSWTGSAQVAAMAANISRRDDKAVRLAAKVRELLPADARRTGVYDSLVATSLLPCPDDGVKDLAARHAAMIAASPVLENPELRTFLHVMGLGKKDDSPTDATRPPDLSPLLPDEKDRICWGLRRCIYSPGNPARNPPPKWREAEELLGLLEPPRPVPTPPPPPVAEVSDYDRLKSLEGAGNSRSEEALTLARKALDKCVNERKPYPSSDVNLPVKLLVDAGVFDAYLGQTHERLTKEAWPEAEIQRALMHLHSYRIIHPVETALPYANKLLELVPMDVEAAKIVFELALKNKDADTVQRCLVVFAAHSGFRFQAMLSGERRGNPLSLFRGEKAAELIRALVATPMGGTAPNHWDSGRESYERGFLELLYFALNEAPEQFDVLLDWTKLLDSNDKVLTLRLAEAMKKAGMPDKAVSMLAEHYFSIASEQSAEPLRFAEKQRQKAPVERQWIPIKELARAGLLAPLAALAATTEPTDGNRRDLALVRLAARPTMEAWKNIVAPALAATPISERDNLRGACLYAASQVDGSEELRTLITVEEIRSGKSRHELSSLDDSLKLAASLDAADRDELFPVIWKRAAEILAAEHPDPNRDGFIGKILEPMIMAATDADWKAYLEELRKTKNAVESFAFSHYTPLPPEAAVDRLRDVAQWICEMAKPGKPPGPLVLNLVAKLGESGDFDNDVAAFRPLLFNIDMTLDNAEEAEKRLLPSRRLVELVSGDPSAILPVLDAQADERGACQFRWCLAGDGVAANPSPRNRHFKQFDGRFDVALMAGPEPRRLSRVAEQRNVPSVGMGRSGLPPGSKFAALMVTQRDGSVVHWTDPVAVRKVESWQDLPLPENGDNARGPFGDTSASDVQLEDGTELVLADVAWDGEALPSFSIWAMGEPQSAGVGVFSIRYVDKAGRKKDESGSEYSSVVQMTGSPVRQWCKLELPNDKASPPPATTRIQLVYRGPAAARGDGGRELSGRTRIRLAELKVNLPAIPLPKGVERLGRVPGSICGVAFDAEGKRIALADRDRGVGVFDMETKNFDGWIPLAEKPPENGNESKQLKMMGNRIFHIDSKAKVRVIDLKKRSPVMLNPTSGLPAKYFDGTKMAISKDGSFVALGYAMSGYEVFRINEDGKFESRVFTSGAIWNFAFDEEKQVLLSGEGNRIWTLPLADWKTAEPKLSAGEVSPSKEKITKIESSTGAKLDGRSIYLECSHQYGWRLIYSGKTSVKMSFPQGWLFQAGNERAWLITPSGSIYRIEFGEVGK